MATSSVIARPYAKAMFEYAIEKNEINDWSYILKTLACITSEQQSRAFISNPSVTPQQVQDLLLTPFKKTLKQMDALSNWIKLLIEQDRVLVLSDIDLQYQGLMAEHEKTLEVDLCSFMPLTEKQAQLMTEQLTKKLKRKVTLKASIDPSLLGGVVVKAGDLVIDGSVRGKISAMHEEMLA